MLRTVIGVKADLASRIAIRYVCLLGRRIDMTVSTMHVLPSEAKGDCIGTGWIRQTWEDGVAQRAVNRVTRMVQSEQPGCRMLGRPTFLPPDPDRDEPIARQLRNDSCDLFVEGLVHCFDPAPFFERIGSKLYQEPTCPVLMVKNATRLSKGVLVVTEEQRPGWAVDACSWLFEMPSTEPQWLLCRFDADPSATPPLKTENRPSTNTATAQGSPSTLAALVRDYSLIVTMVPAENSPMAELLSKSPCSILFLPKRSFARS